MVLQLVAQTAVKEIVVLVEEPVELVEEPEELIVLVIPSCHLLMQVVA